MGARHLLRLPFAQLLSRRRRFQRVPGSDKDADTDLDYDKALESLGAMGVYQVRVTYKIGPQVSFYTLV